jgi:fructose-bisphosphate aldolase class II
MIIVPATKLLQEAKEGKYAVGAFNYNGLEDFQGLILASEETGLPFLAMATEGTLKYSGVDYVAAIAYAAAKTKKVPFSLNLDHGQSFEVVMQCLRNGFTTVMIDGSKLPYEENVALTKKVVDAAHAVGVPVEGELGRIAGIEEEIKVQEQEALLTDPEMAVDFVKRTGIDIFAPAIGTAHGFYKGTPKLHFDRLEAVHARLPHTYLALHGGTGLTDEQFKQAIKCGITKVNIGTDLKNTFTSTIRKMLQERPNDFDSRKSISTARDAVKELAKRYLRLFRGLE